MVVAGDTYRTVMHSYNSKQQMIEKMRRQLEQLEQDTATKLEEIDKCNSAFNVSTPTNMYVCYTLRIGQVYLMLRWVRAANITGMLQNYANYTI